MMGQRVRGHLALQLFHLTGVATVVEDGLQGIVVLFAACVGHIELGFLPVGLGAADLVPRRGIEDRDRERHVDVLTHVVVKL